MYTPVEVVDFIIHSVNDILQQEFGETLGSKGVHILDPFTGTGTFVTRLLQSGLISKEDLEYKYKNEIHANEIVLLAYYIAAINIEATYHSLSEKDYTPFAGICLTDTFEMYESDDMVAALMADNSERRTRQKALDIRVIIANPPYNVADTGVEYKDLSGRIASTYAARTSAVNKNSLYDSYIKAIRWASDRIGDRGVIGFVTNGGWLDGNATDGMRKCLEEEFSSIYVFNLRGNQRTSGEQSRREGGKIFGQGSRAPVAISLLVKNPSAAVHGQVFYNDIGDYLTREQKLAKIAAYKSLNGLVAAGAWEQVHADEHGDWVNKRVAGFERYIAMLGESDGIFQLGTRGVETGRDAWVYNSSRSKVLENCAATIEVYNECLRNFAASGREGDVEAHYLDDGARISWTATLRDSLKRGTEGTLVDDAVASAVYRPFGKLHLYYDRLLVHRVGKYSRILPNLNDENRLIMVKQRWNGTGHLALMVNTFVDLQSDGGAQNFPLKLYEKMEADSGDLFANDTAGAGYRVKDGITDYGLNHFKAAYNNSSITKEDIFYYVYGLLHSEEYRERFADNLSKELPRIPAVTKEADFWAFAEAGRKLGDLHVNYESAELYPVTVAEGDLRLAHIVDPVSYFRVEQMRYGGKRGSDKTVLHYNNVSVRPDRSDA